MKKDDPTFTSKDVIIKTEYDNLQNKILTYMVCKKTCSSEGGAFTVKEMYIKKDDLIYYASAMIRTDDEHYDEFLSIIDNLFMEFKAK